MPKSVRYAGMTFESDFLFGIESSGREIRFSRAERILLAKFTANPKAVLSRDRLLDAITGPGSDASDRNIDFVINRLRRKLGDSARRPVYIATQYGEGYVWVADRATQTARLAGAFIVIGPFRGLSHIGNLADQARNWAQELRRRLARRVDGNKRVELDETCPSARDFVGDKPQFALEPTFVVADGRLDCAVTLKDFASGQLVHVSRRAVATGEAAVDHEVIDSLAGDIISAIWDRLAYRASASQAPADPPLALRMHTATQLLGNLESWVEPEKRMRARLAQNPDDHQAQLLLAVALHTKYVQMFMITSANDTRAADEDEMERLVLAALPHLQDNPVFVMTAGKLLYFLDRGHRALALDLVERAFQATTALATSFAILGQIRMFQGRFAEALSLYDQGIELSEDSSEFHIYLLVMKCQALTAAGDRESLDRVTAELYAKKVGARETLSIFFTSPEPGQAAPEARMMAAAISEEQARGLLAYANYIGARLFDHVEHRENLLRTPATILVEHFGDGVIPDEVRATAPGLLPHVPTLAAE